MAKITRNDDELRGLRAMAEHMQVSTASVRNFMQSILVFDPAAVTVTPSGRFTGSREKLSIWASVRRAEALGLPAEPPPKKPTKRGRPKKQKGTARVGNTTVRLSEDDAALITAGARHVDEGVSEFLRGAGRERAVRVLAREKK